MWRSRSSLQGYYLGAVAPWFLAAFHWFCVVVERACSPGHITAYGLEIGPWALLPRSCAYHPPPSHGMARLGVRVCLHILKCCLYYFLEILDFISSESLVPSSVTFDSFSSSALSIFMPGPNTEERVGVLVCVFIHQPPWLLILNGSQVSHTRSPSLLRLNLLLIPKVSILSEQMKFCFSQNTFFLILTKE